MDGNIHTYKARLVAKGFTQTYRVDYKETFSPVADIKAIRILIAITAYYDYEIWKMNVKTSFLNGRLNEDVYMVKPKGFVNLKYPKREIEKYGFTRNPDEPCVYKRASGSIIIFLILYVDDKLFLRINIPMLQDVKSWLGKCYAIKDSGEATFILGIKIYRDRSRRLIGLSQSAYIDKILKRFRMDTSKRGTIPMQPNVNLSKSQGPSTPAVVKRMKTLCFGCGFHHQSTTAMSSMEAEYIAAAEAAMLFGYINSFLGLALSPSLINLWICTVTTHMTSP
nr:retrotransposon protein, putative, Ty1-copia subclass [Tanacetum cinerariifolium]